MAYLNRDQIKTLVATALKSVADYTGDIEKYKFKWFHETLKSIFISELKKAINNSPYYNNDGTTNNDYHYDVALNPDMIENWKTIKDCIEYVLSNQTSD